MNRRNEVIFPPPCAKLCALHEDWYFIVSKTMYMYEHARRMAIYEGGVLKHNLNYFVYHWPNDFVYQKKNNQVRIAKHIYYM